MLGTSLATLSDHCCSLSQRTRLFDCTMDMKPEEWMWKPAAEPSAIMAVVNRAVEQMSENDPTDDFEIMLLHEDFPALLSIALKVKQTRKSIGEILHTHQPACKSSLQPDEVRTVVERMQRALLSRPDHTTIPRGRYPVTDSIMEDSMLNIQREYDCANQWLEARVKNGRKPKTKRERNAVNKYSKRQTDNLFNWMIKNVADPYPTPDAIEKLAFRTGLTIPQVANWTTNVRKRNRKATCENGKKPHHFIDFLFLAHDRNSKQRTPSMPFPLVHRHSPPPTVRQGNHPVPDECISRDIFEEALDNFDQLNALEKVESSLVFDFASSWPDNYSQENRTLLPSVRNDTNDPPRARSNSLDFHVDDDVDDDEVPKNYFPEE